MTNLYYPGLLHRIKAAIIDSIALILLMWLFSFIFSNFESTPDVLRIGAFVFIFLLYDPIMTSTQGGTLGHLLIGIRVRKFENKDKNLPFHFALLRFVMKALLGWISLLTITSEKDKRAIHDLAAGSVVIYG